MWTLPLLETGIVHDVLYWLLEHREWLREISAPGVNTTSIVNPRVCTGQLARTLQHGSVPNLRGTCCNSGAMTLSNFGTGILQTKVHHLASWTSFLPSTHSGRMIVERRQCGGFSKAVGFCCRVIHGLRWLEPWRMSMFRWAPENCRLWHELRHCTVYFAFINSNEHQWAHLE